MLPWSPLWMKIDLKDKLELKRVRHEIQIQSWTKMVKRQQLYFTTIIISRFLVMTVYEEVRLEVNASKIALQQKDWRALQSIKKVT